MQRIQTIGTPLKIRLIFLKSFVMNKILKYGMEILRRIVTIFT